MNKQEYIKKAEEILEDDYQNCFARHTKALEPLYQLHLEGVREILEELKDQDVPVIYREDNGMGLAIPRSVILAKLNPEVSK